MKLKKKAERKERRMVRIRNNNDSKMQDSIVTEKTNLNDDDEWEGIYEIYLR